MKKVGVIGYPFIAIGTAFIAINNSRRPAFAIIGIAFIVLGLVLLFKRRSNVS
jgi:LPXTG-motif cell wall-anchored protein